MKGEAWIETRKRSALQILLLETVAQHVANILAKLGAQNRTQAGALARDSGLLS